MWAQDDFNFMTIILMDQGGCYYQNDETPNCVSRDCAVATST